MYSAWQDHSNFIFFNNAERSPQCIAVSTLCFKYGVIAKWCWNMSCGNSPKGGGPFEWTKFFPTLGQAENDGWGPAKGGVSESNLPLHKLKQETKSLIAVFLWTWKEDQVLETVSNHIKQHRVLGKLSLGMVIDF